MKENSKETIFTEDTELFRWGPAPMKLFFISDAINSIFNVLPKRYSDIVWPETILASVGGRFVWISDMHEVEERGGMIFRDYMLRDSKRERIESLWKVDIEKLEDTKKEIENTILAELSDEELVKLWKEFEVSVVEFWVHGTIPEFSNYGAVPVLDKELLNYVPAKKDRDTILEIMTAPETSSFYQEEEMDLLDTDNISEHQQQYFWLRNSYDSVEVLGEGFFIERKKDLPSNLHENIRQYQAEIKAKKKEIINRYNLSEDIIKMSRVIASCVASQDLRKKHIFQYLHHKDLILKEVVRRYNVEEAQLLNYTTQELIGFLEEGNFAQKVGVRSDYALVFGKDFYKIYEGKDAKELWNAYAFEKKEWNGKEISGTAASVSDKVDGKVRIVLNPKEASDFKEGDILVAPMTTPEYIFTMKKAAAFVTDAGGLTSHAAIVSRELGKPCIVGTKIATQMLKDGDFVEVDSENGLVKIIK